MGRFHENWYAKEKGEHDGTNHLDRPFLFLIREKSTGVILFIGRIDDPNE
jgi:serine protease inhibitor